MENLEVRIWNGSKMLNQNDVFFTGGIGREEYLISLEDVFRLVKEMGRVMLFSGKFDKNGRKIFEGDIIKTIDYQILQEVQNIDGTFYIRSIPDNDDWTPLNETFTLEREVIGNIHENTELINSNK